MENTEPKNDITNEFCRIIGDFIPDLLNTFPEYKDNIHPGIVIALEHAKNLKFENTPELQTSDNTDFISLLDHCKAKLPPCFFDILYENEDIFNNEYENENDIKDTEFLPNIDFRNLWKQNITDKTKDVIWKYLQLIILALLPDINDKNTFGDTEKLFEAIDEDEFKEKLQETVSSMEEIFGDTVDSDISNNINSDNLPNPNTIHEHLNSMFDGKIGKLAQEIAEETSKELDIDFENTSDVNTIFKKLFKNPGKLMNMVKGIGSKLETKMKNGEIDQTELIKEASSMMHNMKDIKGMPGMPDIGSMLEKFGMPIGKGKGKGCSNFNMNAFQSHMNSSIQKNKTRERMLNKLKQNKTQNETVFSKGEVPEKSMKTDKPGKNRRGKKKKKKNKK